MLGSTHLKLSLLNWRRSVKSRSMVSPAFVSPELPDLDRLRGGILRFAVTTGCGWFGYVSCWWRFTLLGGDISTCLRPIFGNQGVLTYRKRSPAPTRGPARHVNCQPGVRGLTSHARRSKGEAEAQYWAINRQRVSFRLGVQKVQNVSKHQLSAGRSCHHTLR